MQWSAAELGITLCFEGKDLGEVGVVDSVADQSCTAVKPGDIIVRIDPRYFRPAEVDALLGDPTKAREKIGDGWLDPPQQPEDQDDQQDES